MHYSNTTSPLGPHHNDYIETDSLGNTHVPLDVFKCTSCYKKRYGAEQIQMCLKI